MARKRRGSKILKGNVDEGLSLGALASLTGIVAQYDNTVNERTFCLSQEAVWSMQDHTANQGGIMVGIAHGDYSLSEIEAYIEATGSWNEGDLTAQEINRRKIRIVGTFPGDEEHEVLNDGKPLKTICKWVLNQGQTNQVWAYNLSDDPFATGSQIRCEGHIWLKPL